MIVTAHDVADGKPHPGFALACARLGVEPSGCAAVEDSPAGIRAARGAGVLTVHGLSTTHTHNELVAAGATEVSADLVGLAARIGLHR